MLCLSGHCVLRRSGNPALLYTLGQCAVRHTKQQVLGGEEVLRLPPKTEELVEGERGAGGEGL